MTADKGIYEHTYRCGISTYTLDSFTKDDNTVRVGYACTSIGIGTDIIYDHIKIPKLESGEIDTRIFYRNLKCKLLYLNKNLVSFYDLPKYPPY